MGKISKAKKLTDAICRDLPRLDKNYFKPGDYPGLQFWVKTGGSKSWFYQYRTKHKKFPQRKKIGNYPVIGVVEAIKRAKDLSTKIYNGEDPKEAETIDVLKMQFGEAIRNYYREELTTVNQYSASTIAGIKGVFGPWVFRNTYDKDILDRVSKTEDIQYKKLSSITPKMFKNLYNVVGSRSPINANRLQEYLRKFWNDFVKGPDNPFVMDSKKKYEENEYLDYLDEQELQKVMATAVQVDQGSGRLLTSHYRSNRLNPVSCMAIRSSIDHGKKNRRSYFIEVVQLSYDGCQKIEEEVYYHPNNKKNRF